jgi:hypothetical protein
MLRCLFTFSSVVSLLLLAAVALLWILSPVNLYRRNWDWGGHDSLRRTAPAPGDSWAASAGTWDGELSVNWSRLKPYVGESMGIATGTSLPGLSWRRLPGISRSANVTVEVHASLWLLMLITALIPLAWAADWWRRPRGPRRRCTGQLLCSFGAGRRGVFVSRVPVPRVARLAAKPLRRSTHGYTPTPLPGLKTIAARRGRNLPNAVRRRIRWRPNERSRTPLASMSMTPHVLAVTHPGIILLALLLPVTGCKTVHTARPGGVPVAMWMSLVVVKEQGRPVRPDAHEAVSNVLREHGLHATLDDNGVSVPEDEETRAREVLLTDKRLVDSDVIVVLAIPAGTGNKTAAGFEVPAIAPAGRMEVRK